ncbi:MAG: PepSY domain-containing protein [Magnetococcus sp. DMHC-1]
MSTSKPTGRRPTQFLRTLHGWLGVILFPLLAMAGISGFYLTHDSFFEKWLQNPSQPALIQPGTPLPIDQETALTLARKIWPTANLPKVESKKFRQRKCWSIEFQNKRLLVEVETGHYHVVEGYRTRSHAFDGTFLDSTWNWERFMKHLHTGRIFGQAGDYVASFLSISLIVFSLSGLYLWLAPRLRRTMRKNP